MYVSTWITLPRSTSSSASSPLDSSADSIPSLRLFSRPHSGCVARGRPTPLHPPLFNVVLPWYTCTSMPIFVCTTMSTRVLEFPSAINPRHRRPVHHLVVRITRYTCTSKYLDLKNDWNTQSGATGEHMSIRGKHFDSSSTATSTPPRQPARSVYVHMYADNAHHVPPCRCLYFYHC
jgi:hypothetical protein